MRTTFSFLMPIGGERPPMGMGKERQNYTRVVVELNKRQCIPVMHWFCCTGYSIFPPSVIIMQPLGGSLYFTGRKTGLEF